MRWKVDQGNLDFMLENNTLVLQMRIPLSCFKRSRQAHLKGALRRGARPPAETAAQTASPSLLYYVASGKEALMPGGCPGPCQPMGKHLSSASLEPE